MFIVNVKRFSPYAETLTYEFDDYDDALEFAQHEYNLYGVDDVTIEEVQQ